MVGDLDTLPLRHDAEQVLEELATVRERTLALVAHLPPPALEAAHSPLMSPLVWDLAHIAAYEDLWLVHRASGEPLLRAELAAVYDAFETPRAIRAEIELLDAPEALSYLHAVRERTAAVVRGGGVHDYSTHEMVLRHELQHSETMLQTMALADLLPPRSVIDRGVGAEPAMTRAAPAPEPTWIELDGGRCVIGADRSRFSYDNERPRHEVSLRPYAIAAEPVSNRQWRRFCEQDGYSRREHWSRQGWEWLQRADPPKHPSTGDGHHDDPVCHLCFHEADALARFLHARLPSEHEWEHAVISAPERVAKRRRVWEWTSSEFDGYPGFIAHPYREYSEVFFARGYRVLRGGSWASSERVATATFRNWDLPVRRQIFAGVRLARDS
ncbi:MAG: SUMF1/EgtB/PvdO family nonheme iron enzyme [Solirubrobacteraceae bacterium]